MPPKRRSFLQAFIQGCLNRGRQSASQDQPRTPVLVATSGTAMAIGSLAARRRRFTAQIARVSSDSGAPGSGGRSPDQDDPEQRRALAPINDRRAEIIVPGALIPQTTMKMLGVEDLVLSERALREGLIVD